MELTGAEWAQKPKLALNPGLVAIIGARGSGKTALADAIAAGCDATEGRLSNASFIVRAREHLDGAGVRLTWETGDPSVLPILRRAGIELEASDGGVVVRRSSGGLRGVSIETGPFSGFATDLQAPVMAMLCFASGESVIKEMIFEQRFRHVGELQRMAASIEVDGDTATIQGGEALRGAALTGTDVRASAALVVAALGAVGKSTIEGIDHLDRGYDNMVEKLRACNADITRAFL